MRFFLFGLSIALAASALASPLRVQGTRFIDKYGRQVLLRGVNVSGAAKVPPFQVIRGPEDFAPLRAWGFNAIRLLFNWEAFESVRDQYDNDYLQYYLRVIRWAALHKLYVIVDIHQDAYSRYSVAGCGEGFPAWALPPEQVAMEPKNDESCASWFLSAITDLDMHAAWHHFYKNTWGVRDKYLRMLRKLSKAVADEPNVVGIDLMNEPWGEEETELFELYKDAAEVVRREMPNTILFLSPVALTSLVLKTSTLPKIKGRNIVHSTHFYDPEILAGSWSQWALDQAIGSWKSIEAQWKSPIFIGEFGARPDLSDASGYLDNIYNHLDQGLYSGAIWVYSPSWNSTTKDGWNVEDLSINDERGQLRGAYRPRPFVEKTPGELLRMAWDREQLKLTFAYKPKGFWPFSDIVVPANLRWIGLGVQNRSRSCLSLTANRIRCTGDLDRSAGVIKVVLQFEEKPAD